MFDLIAVVLIIALLIIVVMLPLAALSKVVNWATKRGDRGGRRRS